MSISSPPGDPRPIRIPARRQLTILTLLAVGALALLLLAPLFVRLLTPAQTPAPAAPPPGTFRATPQQWRTLGFAMARTVDFVPSETTEGVVAQDDSRTTQVFSPFTGRVTRVLAQVGDHVRPGQPLFAIAAAEYVQAQNDLITASAQVRLTQATLARQEALLKDNGAALKDVQQARTDAINAKAALQAAQNRLRVLGASTREVAHTLALASAAGISPDTVVRSPIGGVVIQRALGVGQNVASMSNNAGGTPAFTVSDISTIWLVGQVREGDAARAKVGEAARVTVPALAGREWRGRIDFVSPTEDPSTRRIAVRISVENSDGALKPQMFASFELIGSAVEKAVGVPSEAVLYEGDTARVWVADRGRVLGLRQVRTGRTQGGLVEIISGLSPGETVVTSGSIFIDRAAKGD